MTTKHTYSHTITKIKCSKDISTRPGKSVQYEEKTVINKRKQGAITRRLLGTHTV
jgi:hypothetical protein